jgi:hypothetical protein
VQEVILCSEAKTNSEGNQKTKEKRREEKRRKTQTCNERKGKSFLDPLQGVSQASIQEFQR